MVGVLRRLHVAAGLLIVASPSILAAGLPWHSEQCAPASPIQPAIEEPTPSPREIEEGPPPPVQRQPPTMFMTPAPSGEVAGARRGFALPSLHISIPKFSFETPELRFNGGRHYRRDAHMQFDGGVAPAVNMQPALFGQLMTGQSPAAAYQNPAPAAPSPAPPQPKPAAPTTEPNFQENCVLNEQLQEVRALTAQVQQLQAIVVQLAEMQAGEAAGRSLDRSPHTSQLQPNGTKSSAERINSFAELDQQRTRLQQLLNQRASELQQRTQEFEAMQAKLHQLELHEKGILEKRLQALNAGREERLRTRIDGHSKVHHTAYEEVQSRPAPNQIFPTPTDWEQFPDAGSNQVNSPSPGIVIFE